MISIKSNLLLVQALTLSRAISALIFISVALTPNCRNLAIGFFVYACLSDLLDGFLARRLNCSTKIGGVLDLFSDKYLTIISALYAIMRGISPLPCVIIVLREVLLLSLRSIKINEIPIFPPQRILGTITILPIWVGTFLLLEYPTNIDISWDYFIYYYWIVGGIVLINLIYKIKTNWLKIIDSFEEE